MKYHIRGLNEVGSEFFGSQEESSDSNSDSLRDRPPRSQNKSTGVSENLANEKKANEKKAKEIKAILDARKNAVKMKRKEELHIFIGSSKKIGIPYGTIIRIKISRYGTSYTDLGLFEATYETKQYLLKRSQFKKIF